MVKSPFINPGVVSLLHDILELGFKAGDHVVAAYVDEEYVYRLLYRLRDGAPGKRFGVLPGDVEVVRTATESDLRRCHNHTGGRGILLVPEELMKEPIDWEASARTPIWVRPEPESLVHEDNILWIDFETTGLMDDPNTVPLEVSAIVTDKDLNELGFIGPLNIAFDGNNIGKMSDYVYQMHLGSGVLQRSVNSTMTADAVDSLLTIFGEEYLPSKGEGYRGWVIAGNSVKFDHAVIDKFFPWTKKQLDYRVIDVSSVGELVKRWAPEVYAAMPEKKRLHDSLSDIRESIEELRYYRSKLGLGVDGDV